MADAEKGPDLPVDGVPGASALTSGPSGRGTNPIGVTVEEVWQLALPADTVLAGGKGGLLRPVEWVSALRAVFPLFGALGEGYLALARLGLARRLDANLTPSYLLQELHRARASAFVVDEPVTSSDGELAEVLGLPLLVLPPGTDLHEVEREVLRTLVDREARLARRELEVRHHLQQTLGTDGLQAVLEELARVVSGTAQVTDRSGLTAACAAAMPVAADIAQTTIPIKVAGRVLGQLQVSAGAAALRAPLGLLYARQAAEVCGIEMLQQLAREETEDRLGADLVERLLDESQDEITQVRLLRLGYDLSPTRRHMVVAIGNGGADGARSLGVPQILLGDERQSVARDLEWAAQRDRAVTLLVRHREQLLVLCAIPEALPDRSARFWVQEALAHGGTAQRVTVGMSRVIPGLAGLRQAVAQAIDALSLGRRIAGRRSPYAYEELGLYRLLAGLRTQGEIRRFYDETLGALAQYDQAHNTELVSTLEVFFEQNANGSQTARALFVHRNTLNYRLQRIVEITGLDLNDAEARLAMQLALKLHRLAGA